MDYQKAKNIRGKSFSDMMADQMVAGRGIGSSFATTISDRTKAKMMGMKEKFDPLNIARVMTGGSRLAPALLGKMLGRSPQDIQYFASDKKKLRGQSDGLDAAAMDSANQILGLIYRSLIRANERKKLENEESKNRQEEEDSEEDRRNAELVKVLTSRRKKKKTLKEVEKELPKRAKPPAPQKPVSKEVPTPAKPSKVTPREAVKPKPKAPEKVTKAPPKPSAEKVKVPTLPSSDKDIMSMIKSHEGVRTKPYKDSMGLWTVGVGHLIGDGKTLPPEWNREFSMQEVDALFIKDYEHHKQMATKTPGWDKANETGKAAMIDLAFNMGGAWYNKFPATAKSLEIGDFNKAADNLQDSKWYKQVKSRGAKIVDMIRKGKQVDGVKASDVDIPLSTGARIDSSSKENRELKKDSSTDNAQSQIINNSTSSTSSSTSKTPTSVTGDDRPAYEKKVKG